MNQDNPQGISLESIRRFSDLKAKGLLLRVNLIGGFLLLLIFGYLVFSHYQTKLSYLFNSVEESIAQAVIRGDQHILDNIAKSINQADDVDAVWVTESAGGSIVGFSSKSISRDLVKTKENQIFLEGMWLKTTFSHPLTAPGFGKVGSLQLLVQVPVFRLLSLAGVILGIFLFVSLSILNAFKRLADTLSSPIIRLSERIQSTDAEGFPDFNAKEFQFYEIQSVATSFENLLVKKEQSERLAKESLRDAVKGRIAAVVVHDVRQRLHNAFAMIEAIKRKIGVQKELTMLHTALASIDRTIVDIPKVDLSNLSASLQKDLAKLNSTQNSAAQSYPVLALIKPVVREYRTKAEVEGKSISFDIKQSDFSLKVSVDVVKFQRVMSNVLSNSFKAIQNNGSVTIQIDSANGNVFITITDTGHGASATTLQKLGNFGFTTFQSNGSGTGLATSIAAIESWNGKMSFDSKETEGFSVKIVLPKSNDTSVYADGLQLAQKREVIVVDDDPEIPKRWRDRFKHLSETLEIRHFESAEAFKSWLPSVSNWSDKACLFDLRLSDQEEDGISLASMIPGGVSKCLVTSNWYDAEVRNRCEKSQLRILSKDVMEFIPIG